MVDIYCSQGHFEQAREICEKILLLNPDDTVTSDKLEEINTLISSQEEDHGSILESETSGPEDQDKLSLMDYFDSKVKPSDKSHDSEGENKKLEKKVELLESWLDRALSKAKEKSKNTPHHPT